MGEGAGSGWGRVEGWGENADNYNWTTIKKKEKRTNWPFSFHLCVTGIGLYRLKSQTDIYFLLLHSLFKLYFKNPKKKTTLIVRDKVTACSLISVRTLKYGCTVFALHKTAQSRGHKSTKCQPPSVTLHVLCSKAILPKEHLFQWVQRWDWFYLLILMWAMFMFQLQFD